MGKDTKVAENSQNSKTKEKSNKNILIITAILAVILIVIGLCCALLMPKNGSTVVGNKLGETKEVDGLEIKNINITKNGEECVLTADAYNPTEEVRGMIYLDMVVLNQEGNPEHYFGGYIDRVEPGGTVKITASITADITNAYDINIVKSEET